MPENWREIIFLALKCIVCVWDYLTLFLSVDDFNYFKHVSKRVKIQSYWYINVIFVGIHHFENCIELWHIKTVRNLDALFHLTIPIEIIVPYLRTILKWWKKKKKKKTTEKCGIYICLVRQKKKITESLNIGVSLLPSIFIEGKKKN